MQPAWTDTPNHLRGTVPHVMQIRRPGFGPAAGNGPDQLVGRLRTASQDLSLTPEHRNTADDGNAAMDLYFDQLELTKALQKERDDLLRENADLTRTLIVLENSRYLVRRFKSLAG